MKFGVKAPGLTRGLQLKLANSRGVEGGGMRGVAVKCVEIWQNTGGEGGPLDDV